MPRARPIWSRTGAFTTTPLAILIPPDWSQIKIEVDSRCYGALGESYTAPAVATVNGVVTLTESGAPTGGTWTLESFPATTFMDPTTSEAIPAVADENITAPIAWNASAAAIKAAMVAAGYLTGDVTAAGGTLDATPVTLTFTGGYAGTVPLLETDASGLTGGSGVVVRVSVTTPPVGNGGYGYIDGSTQEVWDADRTGSKLDRFLYLAGVSLSGTYYVTALR